ncbi:MAG TPA: glycine cleavage T C-terminal barrel domain-containing protein [Methylomirabilota bacterium]|nr:glycine cleavage T C-terminal barrel domain-containing protein [Methylomirabilota bacterium]
MLTDSHQALGAIFGSVAGLNIPLHYGDPAAELHAIEDTASVLDLSYRSRLVLLGADRASFLNGQVTNNIKALKPLEGVYAALVTAKAKIQSDLNIYALKDELLLDFEPGLIATVRERLERYIVADDVQIVEVAPHYDMLSVQGPRSAEVIQALGWQPPAKPMSVSAEEDPTLGQVYIINRARAGSQGFDLFTPTAATSAILDKAITAARQKSGTLAGWNALETARIRAGIPRYGQDMTEANLAPEGGIEPVAISYNKGCYIGQEIISRLKAFGQLAKGLRRLEVAESGTKPELGAPLLKEGKEVGRLTSIAPAKSGRGHAALGYVRKEHWDAGSELHLGDGSNAPRVKVIGLPFPPG